MGGRAFPRLCVPRMNHRIYSQVKQTTLKILSKRFASITIIPEAPGKLDYGDVDVVVELSSSIPFPCQQVAHDLGTTHFEHNGPTFAQIDVQVCPPGDLAWTTFVNGYGDLGSILGTFNNGYGFTSKNDGFFVRIEEQEAQNWSASQVFLSKDPDLVMDFLGLDKHRFHQGFESERQLFDWSVKSRFFNRKSVGKKKDNSDMRSRMEKRPMFRNFMSQYLPSLPDVDADLNGTRAAHTNAALVFFKKQDEFNIRRLEAVRENEEEHAWSIIKTTVLEPHAKLESKRLNEVVRALKRFVGFEGRRPYICNKPEMIAERQAQFSSYITAADEVAPNLREWILKNWEEIRSRDRQRAKDSRRLAGQTG
ncbi:hypothetical protein E4T49_07139 [Aureobasidium sp. EXF-10728]|nr:hypothetical protein E4T49_07139 [Aureobasidium sp. EXF-10728]